MHIEFTHARTRPYFRRVLAAGAKRKAQPFAVAAGAVAFPALCIAVGGEFSRNALLIAVPLAVLSLLPLAVAAWLWRREVTVPDTRLAPRTWTLTHESYSSQAASPAAPSPAAPSPTVASPTVASPTVASPTAPSSAASASASAASATVIAWPEFVSFRATDDAYVLRHRAGATYDVPREPLSPDQDIELADFLRAAQ